MNQEIIKPNPDEDFYIRYSKTVNAPTNWGTAEEVFTLVRTLFGPEAEENLREKVREADLRGYSGDFPLNEEGEVVIQVHDGFVPTAYPNKWSYFEVPFSKIKTFLEASEGSFYVPHPSLGKWKEERPRLEVVY